MTRYYAYVCSDDSRSFIFTSEASKDHRTLLYSFEAATWEEACAIYHLRQGWEPYRPEGPVEECPKCSAKFYPKGSGQCWRCEEQAVSGRQGS